jgi:hypothetical protein
VTSKNVPVQVIEGDAKELAAGDHFACALLDSGAVHCWDVGRAVKLHLEASPRNLHIAAGGGRVCVARRSPNDVTCSEFRPSAKSQTVKLPDVAEMVAVGTEKDKERVCAVTTVGDHLCWDAQQGGNPAAARVAKATTIALGNDYSCAGTDDGALCWGGKERGGFPGHSGLAFAEPVEVPGVAGAREIVSNGSAVCALTVNDDLYCWGKPVTRYGGPSPGPQVHSPHPGTDPREPRRVLQGVRDLVLQHETAYALKKDGTVFYWGRGGDGGFASLSNFSDATEPQPVKGVKSATQVVAGGGFGCALVRGGKAKCWGATGASLLGKKPKSQSDEYQNKFEAMPVRGLSGAKQLAAGHRDVCAILAGGKVACWGKHRGLGMKCGPGRGDSEVCTGWVKPGPTVLPGIKGVTRIDMESRGARLFQGEKHLADVTFEPEVVGPVTYTGFANRYKRRVGARIVRSTPVLPGRPPRCSLAKAVVTCDGEVVSGGIRDLVQGKGFACALRRDAKVVCWGDNRLGTVGQSMPDPTKPARLEENVPR